VHLEDTAEVHVGLARPCLHLNGEVEITKLGGGLETGETEKLV